MKGDIININKEVISNNDHILLCQSLASSQEVVLEYSQHQLDVIHENNNNEKIIVKEYLLQVTSNKHVTPMVKELCLHIPDSLILNSYLDLIWN